MNLRELHSDPLLRAILDERARDLARQELVEDEYLGEEMLTFRLGGDGYSLPARYVREVQLLGNCTALPGTPAVIVGLVNVRGRLLAALDIRPLLDLPVTPPASSAMLLIVSAGGTEVGLLADTVFEVRRGDKTLANDPATAAGCGVPWVRGVDCQLDLVLDLPLLLEDPRLIVEQSAD